MGNWILCAVLGFGSIQDIKAKRVSLLLILAGIAGACLVWLAGGEDREAFSGFLLGAVPGAALTAVSLVSRQAVGLGDALMVLVMGLYLGMRRTWAELLTACLLAMLAAVLCIVIFKKGKKYELPFLPFLLAAHLVALCF